MNDLKVFISYAHIDKPWVQEYWRALRDQSNCDAWMDERIQPATNWWTTILENIEAADCVICILTPASCASIYCQVELEYGLALNKTILPLKHEKCDHPIPLRTKNIQYHEFKDGETFAGDRILLITERVLCNVRVAKALNEIVLPSPMPIRPEQPKPNSHQLAETFYMAEEALQNNNVSLAEKFFQQVVESGRRDKVWGVSAKERLKQIRLERERKDQYDTLVNMEKKGLLKDIRVWKCTAAVFLERIRLELREDNEFWLALPSQTPPASDNRAPDECAPACKPLPASA
jgi:hypothetical protein